MFNMTKEFVYNNYYKAISVLLSANQVHVHPMAAQGGASHLPLSEIVLAVVYSDEHDVKVGLLFNNGIPTNTVLDFTTHMVTSEGTFIASNYGTMSEIKLNGTYTLKDNVCKMTKEKDKEYSNKKVFLMSISDLL